jgi:hypothetical protein
MKRVPKKSKPRNTTIAFRGHRKEFPKNPSSETQQFHHGTMKRVPKNPRLETQLHPD